VKKRAHEPDLLSAEELDPEAQTKALRLAAQARGWRKYWLFLTHVVSESAEDDLPLMGAALAHFGMLSIIPLLLLTIAVCGMVFKSGSARDRAIRIVSQYVVPSGPLEGQDDVMQADPAESFVFKQVVDQRGTVGGFGLLALLWICLRIFMTLQRALDRIWKIDQHLKRPIYLLYPVALVTIVVIGLLGWLSVALTSFVSTLRFDWMQRFLGEQFRLPDWGQLLSMVVSILMSILLMFLIYRFLPSAKVRSRSAVYGALTAGVLWELSKHLFASLVASGAAAARIYGAMAGLVIYVVWTYISALIMLFGAEVVYCHATYISVKPVVEDDQPEPQPEMPDKRQGTVGSPEAVDPAEGAGDE
jgi:membrane protein